MTTWLIITLILLLNGFFVATEFALVKLRGSQLEVLVQEGNKAALRTKEMHDYLDKYISATQIGITLASLGLGWIGESTITWIIVWLFGFFGLSADYSIVQTLSVPIAFVLLTTLHIVIGEQLPKYIGIGNPLRTSMAASWGMKLFHTISAPFNRVLYIISNSIAKLLGINPDLEEDAHTEKEIRIMLSESQQEWLIQKGSHELIQKVFAFDDLEVRQIYTPKQFVTALNSTWHLSEIVQTILKEWYSRYPVYKDDLNNIQGILHTKDVLDLSVRATITIEGILQILRPTLIAPLTQSIQSLLKTMQADRVHMAMVQNEFGEIVGLVTMEDIIEELVGEIFWWNRWRWCRDCSSRRWISTHTVISIDYWYQWSAQSSFTWMR